MNSFNALKTIVENQATLEKTMREKCAVEAELDRLYAESPLSTCTTGIDDRATSGGKTSSQRDGSGGDAASRLRAVEAERDEARAKLESTRSEMDRNSLA